MCVLVLQIPSIAVYINKTKTKQQQQEQHFTLNSRDAASPMPLYVETA